ncbi:heme exporter protein CcmB [Cytophagaceae bacterium ABcell3]|nr:heme exporter protein CcmB [Cytophagaceae bacterium ABcell3]
MVREISAQIKKEIMLEWRQRYALNGMLLFAGSTVFICYLSIGVRAGDLSIFTWNALLWIIMLFTAVNAITKSFMQERQARNLYYYNLTSPRVIILSKIIYNVLLMIILAFTAYLFYSLVLGNPVEDLGMFLLVLLLGAMSFSGTLTLISGIASKSGNGSMLMAVLSFPVIIPVLVLLIRCSRNSIDGLERSLIYNDLMILVAINAMVVAVSYLLFPFIWKS